MATPADTCAVLTLPKKVLGLLIAKLPLLYVFQLRLVCKQWYYTLQHDFLERYLQPVRSEVFYFWRIQNEFAVNMPDLETNTWRVWPQSFILMDEFWSRSRMPSSYKIFRGDEGLLLVQVKRNLQQSLYLVNPIIRSCKKLPVWSQFEELSIVGMVFDENSKSHKIFTVRDFDFGDGSEGPESSDDEPGMGFSLDVYDSEENEWERIGEYEKCVKHFDLPTFHQGVFYWLFTEYKQDRPIREVYCFDGKELWKQDRMAPIPCGLDFAHMFRWQGNLMLVGGRGGRRRLSHVQVWKLNEQMNIWEETMSMPDRLLHNFRPSLDRAHTNFRCHTGADLLYLVCNSQNPLYVRNIVCNLSKNSWWELPRVRGSLDNEGGSFLMKPTFADVYQ